MTREGWFRYPDQCGDGVGAQVWVAYRNPHNPLGWNLRVQWTPIRTELGTAPEYWRPLDYPDIPETSAILVTR